MTPNPEAASMPNALRGPGDAPLAKRLDAVAARRRRRFMGADEQQAIQTSWRDASIGMTPHSYKALFSSESRRAIASTLTSRVR